MCGRNQSDTPGRRSHSWKKCDRGSRVSCKGRHTWGGVSRRPGCSGSLHREGEPSASLFRMMAREVLDWRVAGLGSVHCRRAVSPNKPPAGGERTGCRWGKDASPTASPSKNEGELDLHTKPRRVAVTDLWGERVRGGQKRFSGLTSPRNGETALLIPTRRSGTTRISRSGRPVGPLQVNPLAWLLAGKRPATGSPNRSRGRTRGLDSTARGLLSGERLLPRHREGGSGIVPWSPRHELLESSRLRFGWAELIHYSANRFPK